MFQEFAAASPEKDHGTGRLLTRHSALPHGLKPFGPIKLARRLSALLLAVAFLVSVLSARSQQVTVFAAASLTESLQEIAVDYEKTSGVKVVFNFGASSTLARQIEEGAPADVFFSADDARMNALEAKGLIVKETRRNRLSNTLVIVVPATGGVTVRSPADLARPEIRRVALGNPQAVPIGVYARAYLETLGLWQAVSKKIVPTENVRAALAAVESGDADASIVYRTDALIGKKVKMAFEVPASDGPKISYPVAMVKGTVRPDEARKFLAYLATASTDAVFRKHGFLVPKSPDESRK